MPRQSPLAAALAMALSALGSGCTEPAPPAPDCRVMPESLTPVISRLVASAYGVYTGDHPSLESGGSFEITTEEKLLEAFPELAGTPPQIDWTTERVWVVLHSFEALDPSDNPDLLWVGGDATRVVLNFAVEPYCNGAAPGRYLVTEASVLPADGRAIEEWQCGVGGCDRSVEPL